MGRYSFFILSFCYRGHYVYADSSSSDVLLDSSSLIDVSGSDSTIDSESSPLDSSSSVQQEESTSTSVSEESSEEGIQDSLDQNYEYYDLSNPFVFGNINNGEDLAVDQNIMPRTFTTFAASGPSTVYAGPNNGWNITGYFTSWRLDGTLNATMIANNIDMIVNQARNSFSFVNSRLNGLENWRSSTTSTISNLNSSVSSQRTQISNAFSRIAVTETQIGNLSSSVSQQGTSITSLRNNFNTLDSQVSSIISKNATQDTQISNLSSAISQQGTSITNLRTDVATLQAQVLSSNDLLQEISNRIRDLTNLVLGMSGKQDTANQHLKSIYDYQQLINAKLLEGNNYLKNISDYQALLNEKLGKIRDYTEPLASIDKSTSFTNDRLKDTNTFLDAINNKFLFLNSEMTLQGTEMLAQTELFKLSNNYLKNISDHQTLLNEKLGKIRDYTEPLASIDKSTSFTNDRLKDTNALLDLINNKFLLLNAEMTLQGTEMLAQTELFKLSNNYLKNISDHQPLLNNKLLSIDNGITNLVTAINSLKTNIQAQFDLYFTDGGFFWKAYDQRFNQLETYFDMIYNMDNKDSMLYRLIYFFIDEMTKTRDFVIEINDNLLIANDSLLIIIDWLRMIYSKPPSNVNVVVPAFDFDRLQQILDGLNFGNIVNEAGTNIWDFLSQLIKTLGEIISTAISGLTDVVGEILDLLGDLINQIIKLIVPENLDFLDTGFGTVKSKIDIKFGSFLSLGNQVKEVVQPIDQDFKKVVSIDIMGAKFNPDFSTIDWVVVRFRTVMALSIWMSVAIYIYRKITGNGDLINDN
ncbi:GumC domain-containing protein [Enterococcus gallinarum]|uniref:hypothetical protein n=1 Tax=Enterococcus gallinarum TaxID=1353 RepID=UPI001159774D|nr:hypothetical protein [Enterococcus gallinarum]